MSVCGVKFRDLLTTEHRRTNWHKKLCSELNWSFDTTPWACRQTSAQHTNHPDSQSVSHSVVCWGRSDWPPRVKVKFNTEREQEGGGGGGVQTERQTDVMSSSSRPPHTLKQMTRETPRSPAVMDTGTAQYNQSNRYEDKHLNWFLH